MNGTLKSPLMVVLNEKFGFGPRTGIEARAYDNLFVRSTTNGNINKVIIREFVENVVEPNIDETCILVVDALCTQQDQTLYQLNNKQINLISLPGKSTEHLQPLDCYGFRQWKIFVKNFTEFVELTDYDIDLHLRNNVLRLQSLILNQFQSDKFNRM